jgi:predicted component of type VI protein secretion system
MVLLTHLSGTKQGQSLAPQRYPFRVGRGEGCDLRLQEPGVWGEHFGLEIRWGNGVWVQSNPMALTSVNGQRVAHELRLRNGDVIEAGPVRMRFSIKPAVQRGLRWRETMLWVAMVALWVGQVFLIWRVMP